MDPDGSNIGHDTAVIPVASATPILLSGVTAADAPVVSAVLLSDSSDVHRNKRGRDAPSRRRRNTFSSNHHEEEEEKREVTQHPPQQQQRRTSRNDKFVTARREQDERFAATRAVTSTTAAKHGLRRSRQDPAVGNSNNGGLDSSVVYSPITERVLSPVSIQPKTDAVNDAQEICSTTEPDIEVQEITETTEPPPPVSSFTRTAIPSTGRGTSNNQSSAVNESNNLQNTNQTSDDEFVSCACKISKTICWALLIAAVIAVAIAVVVTLVGMGGDEVDPVIGDSMATETTRQPSTSMTPTLAPSTNWASLAPSKTTTLDPSSIAPTTANP
eukprot:Sro2687_g334640.1 n/a (328) ;mRNA; f:11507-12492